MPLFLTQRNPKLVELMDRDDCNLHQLENTYRQFSTINGLLSNWKRIYKQRILPKLPNDNQTYTLLDIGFGGGDIPLAFSKWAKKDGKKLEITAIETDQRAFEFAQTLPANPDVRFLNCSSTDLVSKNMSYDFVISNHVLHHLDEPSMYKILNEAKALANHLVIFNDIERSDLGYALFNVFSRPLFWNSFITADGLTSIKRCYTFLELKKLAPKDWKVERSFPFRLLLTYEKNCET